MVLQWTLGYMWLFAFWFSQGISPLWSESCLVMSNSLWPHGLCSPWSSPLYGVGSCSLLQGIFLTQESNWGLLHCRQILYQLSYRGRPNTSLPGKATKLLNTGDKSYLHSKLIQPLWKTVWWFLKKLGIKLPYDPTIPILGINTEKTITEKDTCIPVFIAALFTTARTWKQPRCPWADEWVKNMWYIYTVEYYSTIK